MEEGHSEEVMFKLVMEKWQAKGEQGADSGSKEGVNKDLESKGDTQEENGMCEGCGQVEKTY